MSNSCKDRISIIVPVYNIEKYISRCLDSILGQTYKNIEIIAVDDGSVDLSSMILDKYASDYENIHSFHIKNGGVTNARLFGVKHATGEYIGFVDGDDIIEPEMYSRLMENMKEYGADISHCGYQMILPNNRVEYFYNTGFIAKQDNITALRELLCGSMIEPALCNKLFHKSLFHSLLHDNVMDCTIKENEDLLMNYYLFSKSNGSVFSDKCYYHYMVRDGSSSVKKLFSKHKLEDPIRVQKILLSETKGQPELQKIINGRLVAIYSRGAEMELGEQPELIRPFRRMCRQELRKLLPTLLTGGFSKKTIVYSALAVCCPSLCRKIHVLYSKKQGTYGRYDID